MCLAAIHLKETIFRNILMIGVYLHFALQETTITKVQISSMFVKCIFTLFASLKCYAVLFHLSNMNFNLSIMITDKSMK